MVVWRIEISVPGRAQPLLGYLPNDAKASSSYPEFCGRVDAGFAFKVTLFPFRKGNVVGHATTVLIVQPMNGLSWHARVVEEPGNVIEPCWTVDSPFGPVPVAAGTAGARSSAPSENPYLFLVLSDAPFAVVEQEPAKVEAA